MFLLLHILAPNFKDREELRLNSFLQPVLGLHIPGELSQLTEVASAASEVEVSQCELWEIRPHCACVILEHDGLFHPFGLVSL